ncbi:hypothetical protein COLO4_36791 [Corchorus olitorius]|uniref:Uncharacterized protein n=1 Tax=Corchorus olitorius TaxID=93759 RepID=A0A1R3G5H7_9ROSI|nr:hypothetical protein COLO4_36791 [Corchorus olitorius]
MSQNLEDLIASLCNKNGYPIPLLLERKNHKQNTDNKTNHKRRPSLKFLDNNRPQHHYETQQRLKMQPKKGMHGKHQTISACNLRELHLPSFVRRGAKMVKARMVAVGNRTLSLAVPLKIAFMT